MAIWKPERRFLAVCRRCLGGFGLCVGVVVGGLYGNPMRFVGRVMLCAFSGNSLGFRELGRFGADYCTFRNLECAFFVCGVGAYVNMGKPWARSGALELFRLFRDI